VERAVTGSSSGSNPADGRGSGDTDPALSTAIADLHKFSMMQSMYKSAVHLLDDLSAHAKRLDMPERAQVLLAAAQNPLLGEHHFAKALLPRLCSLILGAHKATRHVSGFWVLSTRIHVCRHHSGIVHQDRASPSREGVLIPKDPTSGYHFWIS
jgi:hypothetical protein